MSRSYSCSMSRSPGSTRSLYARLPRSCAARRPVARPLLFSSHQLELVEDICEEVVIIDHGRIVATGTSTR